jgi:acyl carrier protein
MDGPTFERVAQLIVEECGVRRADVRPDSDLERDLGITGDDAGDLMTAYAREFSVDLADFEFLRHFGPEGCLPGFGLYWRVRHGYAIGEVPVTPQFLVDAARQGRWPDFRRPGAAT